MGLDEGQRSLDEKKAKSEALVAEGKPVPPELQDGAASRDVRGGPRVEKTDIDDPGATHYTKVRQLMFERLKMKMNEFSEAVQAFSNVQNTMHQTAENAIRQIK